MKNMQELLDNVSRLIERFECISKEKGDNFNIFEISGLSTREVRTHSAFISELLNPKGTHDMGASFLTLFFDLLELPKFKNSSVKVEKEKYIGPIIGDWLEGGSIDILISGESSDKDRFAVAIENKIYASDQKNQLLRYNKFLRNNYKEHHALIYLTLDGKDATKSSTGENNTEYKKISYREDIINWLERCKATSINKPVLRESISQYIYLIKKLTGQSRYDEMSNEIVEMICKNNNNLLGAFEIGKNILNAKIALARKLLSSFDTTIYSGCFEIKPLSHSDVSGDVKFELKFHFHPSIPGLYLLFTFAGDNFERFICGLKMDGNNMESMKEEQIKGQLIEIRNKLKSENNEGYLGGIDEKEWHNWVYVKELKEPYRSWNKNAEPWTSIVNEDNELKKIIMEEIKYILDPMQKYFSDKTELTEP